MTRTGTVPAPGSVESTFISLRKEPSGSRLRHGNFWLERTRHSRSAPVAAASRQSRPGRGRPGTACRARAGRAARAPVPPRRSPAGRRPGRRRPASWFRSGRTGASADRPPRRRPNAASISGSSARSTVVPSQAAPAVPRPAGPRAGDRPGDPFEQPLERFPAEPPAGRRDRALAGPDLDPLGQREPAQRGEQLALHLQVGVLQLGVLEEQGHRHDEVDHEARRQGALAHTLAVGLAQHLIDDRDRHAANQNAERHVLGNAHALGEEYRTACHGHSTSLRVVVQTTTYLGAGAIRVHTSYLLTERYWLCPENSQSRLLPDFGRPRRRGGQAAALGLSSTWYPSALSRSTRRKVTRFSARRSRYASPRSWKLSFRLSIWNTATRILWAIAINARFAPWRALSR